MSTYTILGVKPDIDMSGFCVLWFSSIVVHADLLSRPSPALGRGCMLATTHHTTDLKEHMHVILLSLYRWHFQQCGTPQQTHTGTLWLKLHIRDLLGKPLRQNVCTYQLAQFTIPFMWSKGYENSADKTTCRTSRATLHLVAQTSLWVYSVVSLHRIVCLFITTQPGGQIPEHAYLFH